MKEIKSRECKFIFHRPGDFTSSDPEQRVDLHFVKEKVTYTDGSIENVLTTIRDYQRPYWITAEPFRKHKQTKETESLDRLREFYTTETNLYPEIARRLKIPYKGKYDNRRVSSSPYVYGIDINSRVFLKKDYETMYPDTFSKYTFAALDIETNIFTDEIIMISIARPGEVYTVITKDYLKGQGDAISKLRNLFTEYIPESDKIKAVYEVCDNPLELFKKIMDRAHEWSPDFLAIWNIDFEMSNFIKLCEEYDVDIKDYVSDPSIPPEHRFFIYKRSPDVKISASGVRKNTDPQDKWNVVYAPAKFYWIDAMCAYNYVRVNTKKVPTGYGLDSILGHELGDKFKKLKFPGLNADQYYGVDYHKFMQTHHKLEYVIYNQWDVLSMIKLEEKTNDLSTSLPVLSSINPFDVFDSGPKKIVNKLLFNCLKRGRVLGCRNRMHGEDDIMEENLGLDEWVVALPNKYLSESECAHVVTEDKYLSSNIRTHVYDADQVSGYPNNGQQANVSKDTTFRELLEIEGFEKEFFKRENISLMFGPVSHLQYSQCMFNLPDIIDLDGYIKNKLKEGE